MKIIFFNSFSAYTLGNCWYRVCCWTDCANKFKNGRVLHKMSYTTIKIQP